MRKIIVFFVITMVVAMPTQAQPPATQVSVAEQQMRDGEKINILRAELVEQQQRLAELQKTRAVQLAGNDTNALVTTENRLEELNSNIKQLEQEIALATGSAIKTVAVKPVQPVANATATAQKSQVTGPWWDLYNKPPQTAQ